MVQTNLETPIHSMSSKPKSSAVVFAKDIERVADFYRIVLGVSAIYSDKDHIVLDGDGFQLVIHGIPKEIAATIEIKNPPLVRDEMPIKICFPVESIQASRNKAAELGGQIRPKNNEWEARGFRACDGFDPEGNVFQVRESID
jgi:predicted enzyme related to lactoylglutathione lyase